MNLLPVELIILVIMYFPMRKVVQLKLTFGREKAVMLMRGRSELNEEEYERCQLVDNVSDCTSPVKTYAFVYAAFHFHVLT